MKNIFFFIRRHFIFLLFFLLQLFSIYQIVHYSAYHEAVFNQTALQFSGKLNTRYKNVEEYLHLKKTNDSLQKANAELYNKLKENYSLYDASPRTITDSLALDTLERLRKITYRPAKVLSNSLGLPSNYIVLDKGTADGIQVGMGVITHQNTVVGIVKQVSENYSVVMSLLHKESQISGKLLKTGETGTVMWDGKETNVLMLTNIPKSTQVSIGDTIISSGMSTAFPKGKLLGRVESVKKETDNNLLKITFRSGTNFHSLDYVLVIDHADAAGVRTMLEHVKKEN